MESARELTTLPDDELLRRLAELLRQARRVESELVAHIAEVDRRRLYARAAAPSMFAYCTGVLHLSEAEAYLRITVARASREHPALLEMLADGRLHLTGIAKLPPLLTSENRDALLARAAHRSRRQIEELVAELAPKPSAPSSMRKLPERASLPPPSTGFEGWRIDVAEASGSQGGATLGGLSWVRPGTERSESDDRLLRPDGARVVTDDRSFGEGPELRALGSPLACCVEPPVPADLLQSPLAGGQQQSPPARVEQPSPAHVQSPPAHVQSPPAHVEQPRPPAHVQQQSPPVHVQPLGAGRYKVQFTASAELRDKLERLRALMRPQVPDGDLAAIVERAVTEKLERLEARRFARTSRPRKSLAPADSVRSTRYIPAAVRRAVHERDGGRCRYVDEADRRCPERDRLEFHHRHPFGMGGDHDPGNVSLMCRAHNAYLAEHDYGRRAMTHRSRSSDVPRADVPRASAAGASAAPKATPDGASP